MFRTRFGPHLLGVAAAASLLLWASLFVPSPAVAQDGSPADVGPGFDRGLPPLLPRGEEIELARSAAPTDPARDATVLVLERGGYVVAEPGTNGWTCCVSRSRIISLEPICYDPEASRTILPIELRRAKLVEQGVPVAEARSRVIDEVRRGEFPLPAGPALAFMMSPRQVLYSDSGQRAGKWRPHMHVFMPEKTADDVALGQSGTIGGVVMLGHPGTPTASLVVVLPSFTDSGGGN